MIVTQWIEPEENFYTISRWISGLHSLHRSGAISLRLQVSSTSDHRAPSELKALRLRIETEGGSSLVAVDLHDRSDLFDRSLLQKYDVYFKRSFHPPDVARLGDVRAEVRPFGLNFSCRTPGLVGAVIRAVAPRLATRPIATMAFVKENARSLRAIPPIDLLERPIGVDFDPAVVFQTRVWIDEDSDTEPASLINEQRVALIRALRESLGPRFRGGLVPTPLAKSRYPDALAIGDWRKGDYLRMSARCLIGVYSRGLHQSTAWKLSEYLAAGQCVVAEPPRNSLPTPLVEGSHFLPYSDPQECVVACERLLRDVELSDSIRAANRDYYRAEVAPAAHAARRLGEATGTGPHFEPHPE